MYQCASMHLELTSAVLSCAPPSHSKNYEYSKKDVLHTGAANQAIVSPKSLQGA